MVQELIQFTIGFDIHVEYGEAATDIGPVFLPVDHLGGAFEMEDVGIADGDFREDEARNEHGIDCLFLDGKPGIGNIADPALHPLMEKGVNERKHGRRGKLSPGTSDLLLRIFRDLVQDRGHDDFFAMGVIGLAYGSAQPGKENVLFLPEVDDGGIAEIESVDGGGKLGQDPDPQTPGAEINEVPAGDDAVLNEVGADVVAFVSLDRPQPEDEAFFRKFERNSRLSDVPDGSRNERDRFPLEENDLLEAEGFKFQGADMVVNPVKMHGVA